MRLRCEGVYVVTSLSAYYTQLGFEESFIVEDRVALPVKEDVFVYLMGKALTWGLVVYEQVSI